MIPLCREILKLPYYTGPDAPLKSHFQPAHPKFCVVTGPNATGKSVVRRSVVGNLGRRQIECINISMEKRACRSSDNPIMSLFIYGTEGDESTGHNSAKTMKALVRTSRARDNNHMIFLDEPDIGLSEEYAMGMGLFIADFLKDMPEKCDGVFLVTHSRPLLEPLMQFKPSHWRLTDEMTLVEWMNRKIVPATLDELAERGRETWHKVNKILNEREKK